MEGRAREGEGQGGKGRGETELQLVYSLGQRFTFFVQVRGVCVEGLRDG